MMFPGVHQRFVYNHVLNFKELEKKMFLIVKGWSSLIRFIKKKTFNIIQNAGFVT